MAMIHPVNEQAQREYDKLQKKSMITKVEQQEEDSNAITKNIAHIINVLSENDLREATKLGKELIKLGCQIKDLLPPASKKVSKNKPSYQGNVR